VAAVPAAAHQLAGRDLTSRLIVGTGGASSLDVLGQVLAASGTQLTTVAMRRVGGSGQGSLIGVIRQVGVAVLPNTAGCHTAAEALLTARLAREAGWSLGGRHAGHLVGEFPHEEIDGADIESYIAPGNSTPMRRTDMAGRVCHWILEIHLTEPARGFGGFYEQLLDLG